MAHAADKYILCKITGTRMSMRLAITLMRAGQAHVVAMTTGTMMMSMGTAALVEAAQAMVEATVMVEINIAVRPPKPETLFGRHVSFNMDL